MKTGSYHRVGYHDVWFGYQGKDKNILRIERLVPKGVRILDIRIDPDTIQKFSNDEVSKITAKTNKGIMTISHSLSGVTSIKLKRLFIPTFWTSGKESGYKDSDLISKILSTNNI